MGWDDGTALAVDAKPLVLDLIRDATNSVPPHNRRRGLRGVAEGSVGDGHHAALKEVYNVGAHVGSIRTQTSAGLDQGWVP